MSDRTTRVALGGDGIDLAAGLLAPRLVSRTASRAEVVESALEAELRRRLYARDAEIYREQGEDPELEGLGEWMRNRASPPRGD